MAVDYTTTALVASAKRRGFIPAGSGLSTSDILQILTEELRNYIPAFLKGIREEYLVAELEIEVTSPVVQAPTRAVGAAFRAVGWAADGNSYPRPLSRIEPERMSGHALTAGEPSGYVFRGNTIILVPGVSSGTIVLAYQQRPGQLVLPSDCAEVTAILGSTVTVAAKPTAFDDDTVFDFVSAAPNFTATALDYNADGLEAVWTGNDVVLTAAGAALLSVGDYLCAAGETPIPQIPIEVHDLLAQAGALKMAQAQGSSRLDAIAQGLADLRAQLTVILSPRSDGSARPIISRSRIGAGAW